MHTILDILSDEELYFLKIRFTINVQFPPPSNLIISLSRSQKLSIARSTSPMETLPKISRVTHANDRDRGFSRGTPSGPNYSIYCIHKSIYALRNWVIMWHITSLQICGNQTFQNATLRLQYME